VCGGISVAACSPGALMSDVGTITGGAGATGAGGQAGAGHVSGTGGLAGCTAADVRTVCTADVGEPPVAGVAGAPCTVEGAHCAGYACDDSSGGHVWEATCCLGVWLNFAGPCPAFAGAP
jgi:hypothetical protein